MKRLILILFLVCLFGCSKELPEGYSFLCSPEGKITLEFPDGDISANVWETKYGAAAFARHWEKVKNEPHLFPSDKYKWSKCDSE